MRIIALAITVLMLGTNVFGDDISPNEILKKVVATYSAMKTYKAEGTITSDIDIDGMKTIMETSFSILLKKPNLYLISWAKKNMFMPSDVQPGTVWSDGIQPYLYMGKMNTYSKVTSDEIALSSATGVSGGVALTIPLLFLPVFKNQPAPFSRIKDPKIEKTEKVGGEDCYVLSGSSAISKKETFWISKTSYLIRKYYRSFEPPEGIVIPEMTDEQLEEAIKGMGQEVTEESKKSMREMLEKSKAMLQTAKMNGFFSEFHANVSSPELNRNDFKFALPEGAVLKDSLFGGMFGGNKGISDKSMNHDRQ